MRKEVVSALLCGRGNTRAAWVRVTWSIVLFLPLLHMLLKSVGIFSAVYAVKESVLEFGPVSMVYDAPNNPRLRRLRYLIVF